MATAEQIKSLVKAHVERNDEKFKTIALQIAAHEAKMGHSKIARDLKLLIDKPIPLHPNVVKINNLSPMLELKMQLHKLSELIVSDDIHDKIRRILVEYENRNKLNAYGLVNRRNILIVGAPGTGKTLTASVIATELSLPFYTVQMDKIVTKYMGETSVKLRQIFENIESNPGVYLFDEFDAIGIDRNYDNEVGEMRRILNSFLQFLEQGSPNSIIVAATNNPQVLDSALFRRFDDVLQYDLPTSQEIKRLFIKKLVPYDRDFVVDEKIILASEKLSHAEISRICEDAIKNSILTDVPINHHHLLNLVEERHHVYSKREV